MNRGQRLSGGLVPLTLVIPILLIVSKRCVDIVLECHLFIVMLLGIEEPKSIRPSSLLKALFFVFCSFSIGAE